MSGQVLHVDFVALNPSIGTEDRERLLAAAAELGELQQVVSLGVIEAGQEDDFDLAFYFALEDFLALEPFGTDQRYARFLQGEVAPRLKAFAGADVALDRDFPEPREVGACLAIAAPDETYDWEIREALEAWTAECEGDAAVVGVAVGERQFYRGLAIAFGSDVRKIRRPDDARFRSALLRGSARKL